MLFNSFTFIYFFVGVFIAFWSLPNKYRWILLLSASYFFYMSWEVSYVLLILISTAIDYFLCRYLTGSENKKRSKQGLVLSILLNMGLLFTFKYYNFFQTIIHDIFWLFDTQYTSHITGLLLPVGISFYTFQTLSYSIDVYRKKTQPEKHFGKFALYVSFFPQLVAGPIERASDLLGQFNKKSHYFNTDKFKDGLLLLLWGICKKVVIADNIKAFTDHVFDYSEFQNGGMIVFGLFLFTIQVYADFSGYSDIAIGTAKILGYDLKQNFRTPYFSQNITEFWSRWHITFTNWLRDYVYIPLGGNRKSKIRNYFNVFITFFLSGLWHGASWNFIIWGTMHGLLATLERMTGIYQLSKKNISIIPRTVLTFTIITLTMLPVRANNFEHLKSLTSQIIGIKFHDLYFAIADNKTNVVTIVVILIFAIDFLLAGKTITALRSKGKILTWSLSILFIVSILFVGNNAKNEFFYFKF